MIMKYKCTLCGSDTDNVELVGKAEIHCCDKCRERINKEVEWEGINEHWREAKITCPYCDHEYEDYECYEFDEGKTEEVECPICDRKFDVDVIQIRKYSTKRSTSEMPEDFDPENFKEKQ